jgi:hypothetical protein
MCLGLHDYTIVRILHGMTGVRLRASDKGLASGLVTEAGEFAEVLTQPVPINVCKMYMCVHVGEVVVCVHVGKEVVCVHVRR